MDFYVKSPVFEQQNLKQKIKRYDLIYFLKYILPEYDIKYKVIKPLIKSLGGIIDIVEIRMCTGNNRIDSKKIYIEVNHIGKVKKIILYTEKTTISIVELLRLIRMIINREIISGIIVVDSDDINNYYTEIKYVRISDKYGVILLKDKLKLIVKEKIVYGELPISQKSGIRYAGLVGESNV